MIPLITRAIAALRRSGSSGSAASRAAQSPGQFDTVLSRRFEPNEPGAAIIATKDGEPMFRKAYGMADLEHEVPLQPDMTFRLGSLTKQFTSAAIMMLEEQRRLSLDDDIAGYLPDSLAHGMNISVENLLTHTSGIKGYTEMRGFKEITGVDMSVEEMIDFFKNEPLQFEPGTRFRYSNSGYFLLGVIIEKVSGQSYASFLADHIFVPLGMTQTAYEGHERVTAERAIGYSGGEKAQRISMTQPYAAGALVSSVDDLAKWDAAISSGKLLGAASWERIFTPFKLRSGRTTNYAYGWGAGRFKGRRSFMHGGGIPGFLTFAMRIPEEKLYVAVLMNDDGGGILSLIGALWKGRIPGALAGRLAAMSLVQ